MKSTEIAQFINDIEGFFSYEESDEEVHLLRKVERLLLRFENGEKPTTLTNEVIGLLCENVAKNCQDEHYWTEVGIAIVQIIGSLSKMVYP